MPVCCCLSLARCAPGSSCAACSRRSPYVVPARLPAPLSLTLSPQISPAHAAAPPHSSASPPRDLRLRVAAPARSASLAAAALAISPPSVARPASLKSFSNLVRLPRAALLHSLFVSGEYMMALALTRRTSAANASGVA